MHEAAKGLVTFGSLTKVAVVVIDTDMNRRLGLSVRNVSPAANRGDLQTGNWSMTLARPV
jgi:hypothetical protein